MNKERVLLICCEGKETECQYFNAIKNQYRISQGSVRVKVIGGLGQHKRLIDESVVHRTQLVEKYGLCDEDIEVWAVCDNDDMSIAYTDLLKYAKENSVKLAFSDPAFEIYLLQHFGFRASTANRAELNNILTRKIGKKYNKTDLAWFVDMIYNNPKILQTVIQNCHRISNPDNVPLTTVHLLVEKLLKMAPKA